MDDAVLKQSFSQARLCEERLKKQCQNLDVVVQVVPEQERQVPKSILPVSGQMLELL
jgi:hypothetical protein